jgi:hypothetical protein
MRQMDHKERMLDVRNAYTLGRALEGKRSHDRHGRRWKGNKEINVGERGCEDVDFILFRVVSSDDFVSTLMNLPLWSSGMCRRVIW